MTLHHPLDYSATTHPGLKRENNEDCFLSLPDAGLWAVADGMGGHEAGEVASAIVRDTLAKHAKTATPFVLTEAIQRAHQAILQSAEVGVGAHGMGSTLVALYSQKRHYQVAWVGDSRAYLWTPAADGGHLSRLTVDHSYVQMLFSSGAISAEEVETHPDKNIITQCLGMQELTQVKVDLSNGQWQKNQWILLCSDGLSDELNDEAMAQILEDSPTIFSAVDQLLHAALTHGGSDNITVQIVESPLNDHPVAAAGIRNWIPQISNNPVVDVVIFVAAITVLLGLLITTLT